MTLLSAQESRRRRKEYIDTLERKLRHCQTENDNLRSRLEALEKNNADLVNEVKTLKGDTINDNRSSTAVIVDRHRQQVQSAQGPHSGGVTLTALFLLFAVLIPSIPVWSGLNFFGCMIRFPATLDNGSGSILFDGERYSPIRSQIFDESTTRVEHDLEMEKPLTTTTNSHSRLLQSDYSDTNEYHDFAFAAQFLGQFKTICPVEPTVRTLRLFQLFLQWQIAGTNSTCDVEIGSSAIAVEVSGEQGPIAPPAIAELGEKFS
uniref:BZIP domain-containing protein n=1 Tax=Romanomermis culicivorax TaxID=13658 RepID=A0A915L7C1_ROMCU